MKISYDPKSNSRGRVGNCETKRMEAKKKGKGRVYFFPPLSFHPYQGKEERRKKKRTCW